MSYGQSCIQDNSLEYRSHVFDTTVGAPSLMCRRLSRHASRSLGQYSKLLHVKSGLLTHKSLQALALAIPDHWASSFFSITALGRWVNWAANERHSTGTTRHSTGTTRHSTWTTRHSTGTTRYSTGTTTTRHSTGTTRHSTGTTRHSTGLTVGEIKVHMDLHLNNTTQAWRLKRQSTVLVDLLSNDTT